MMSFSLCDQLKEQLDDLRPVEEQHMPQIRAFWNVGLTYASNALEGSTLTESETKIILEDGLTVSGKLTQVVEQSLQDYVRMLRGLGAN